jgi:hypothetical protein
MIAGEMILVPIKNRSAMESITAHETLFGNF